MLYLLIIFIIVLILVPVYYYTFFIIPTNKKLKEIELNNNKMELFSKIDPEYAKEAIDKYIDDYIQKYAMYHIISKKIEFIKHDNVTEMVKELTHSISLEISDLYIYYIKLIRTINTDDELITYIYEKVSERVLLFTTNYNSK